MIEHSATPLSLVAMRLTRFAASCALVLLAGCATVSTVDGQRMKLTSEDFRGYVERVFREQNRVADEVAFALEAPGAPRNDLADAEQRLLDACAGVNELATARRDELRLGMRRSLAAARTVPQCEAITRAVAEALNGARAP
jgi:energy-coupling factor transporter ATP-binding protein EcfA2